MSDELVTRDQVMRWLPDDIRDRLAETTPCFGGQSHQWQHRAIDMTTLESAFTTTVEWWSCTVPGCNLTVRSEPQQ